VDHGPGDDHESHLEGEEPAPGELAMILAQALAAELGAGLQGAIAHGSWVHGDFAVGRSDVDLLVLLRDEPSADPVTRIEPIVARVVEAHSRWRDRIEMGFVTKNAVQDVLENARASHLVARVSPGEPLHLVRADLHQALDWEAATRGVSLYGADAEDLLPTIPAATVRAVVHDHLRWWGSHVVGVEAAGRASYQSYAILTVSRAAALLSTGERLSKRRAARRASTCVPPVASVDRLGRELVVRGRHPGPPPDAGGVARFVAEVSADRDHDTAPS
jgi:hypothetical protein